MRNFSMLFRGVAVSGLIALAATGPAMAEGKGDRAQKAIAEAQGKVDAAARVPLTGDVPHMVSDANTQLKMAQESVSAGHKEQAIQQAIQASQIADHALTESRQQVADNNASHRADVAAAQADAAAANARAQQAEQNAAQAQAQADAARAQPPVLIAQAPQPATTEVTTTTSRPATTARRSTHVVKKTVSKPVRVAATERTTTTVTTSN